MLDSKPFQQSGHLDHYQQNMYRLEKDDVDACVKPMNCPGHMLIYKSELRSYKDLPYRIFELGTVCQEVAGFSYNTSADGTK